MNKNVTRTSILIIATILLGIGTVIVTSGSHVSATPAEAKTHLNEGIKAIQSGDTNIAMIHIKAAESALTGS